MIKLKNNFQKLDFTKVLSYLFTFFVVLLASSVVFFIIWKSAYFIKDQKGFGFLLDWKWDPEGKQFGFGNIILATFWTLFLVMVLVFFINKFTSIFISSFLSPKLRRKVTFFFQFLSGLPSILFGVFVSLVILEIFKKLGVQNPKSMIGAIIVLVFMILPTTLTLTINKLNTTSKKYEYSAYAIGLKKTNIIFDIVYKNSHKQIVFILLFGFFRAIGEVTAVALVAGNSTNAPDLGQGIGNFFFESVLLLSPLIGIEIKENAGTIHESALFTASLLIMVIVLVTNIFVFLFVGNFGFTKTLWTKIKSNWMKKNQSKTPKKISKVDIFLAKNRYYYWRFLHWFRYFWMISFFLIVMGFFSWIIGDILVKSIPGFEFKNLITTSGNKGLLSMLVVTLLLIMGTLIFSVPLAFFASIYLNEYAKKGSKFARSVQFLMFQLASSPSILFGMFGFVFFVSFLGFGFTILSASLTMILVVFPIIVKTITQNLEAVPQSYRHVAFALGLTQQQVIWKIVIPSAIKGIAISLIFATNRIISEVSPYIIILGGGTKFPHRGFLSTGRTLSTQMYYLQSESPASMSTSDIDNLTYQTALITLFVIFIINLFIEQMNNKKSIKK